MQVLRDALPKSVRLHLLGFGKIEELAVLEEHGVTSFDTTSPLLRAFKDARKNYWVRTAEGDLSYYTAIRIPQATENNKLKHKALEGSLNQEDVRRLEDLALRTVRAYAAGNATLDEGLDAVMDYWTVLNWDEDASPSGEPPPPRGSASSTPTRSATVRGSDAVAESAVRAASRP